MKGQHGFVATTVAALIVLVILVGLAAWAAIGGMQLQLEKRKQRIEQLERDVDQANGAVKALRQLRKEDQAKVAANEKVDHDTQARINEATAAARGAQRAAASLRDEIARLNARPAPADPAAAGLAAEASVARELLGACSTEYHWLAGEAEGLRVQVAGLQDWAHTVPQAR